MPRAHPPSRQCSCPFIRESLHPLIKSLRPLTQELTPLPTRQQRERSHGGMTVLDLSDAANYGGAIPVHHQQLPSGGPTWGPPNGWGHHADPRSTGGSPRAGGGSGKWSGWDAEYAQGTRESSALSGTYIIHAREDLAVKGKSQGTVLPPITPRSVGGDSGEALLVHIGGL